MTAAHLNDTSVRRVLIADDRARTRRALSAVLAARAGFKLVGEAADGDEALVEVERLQPDIVILDVRMPRLDGITAARRIKTRWPWMRVVAHSLAEELREDALAAGADADQSVTLGDFVRRVQWVAAGLRRRGVAAGDIVAYQLPTSLEAVILHYAIAWLGAVASPISLLHREHDLRCMLGLVRPKLIVAKPEYRGHPYADMLQHVAHEVALETEVVGVSSGELNALLAEEDASPAAQADPNEPLYIGWTSGTTGEPKGVVHTNKTGLSGLEL